MFLSVRAGIKGRLRLFVLQKYIQIPLSFAPPGREGGADIGGRLDVLRQTGNGKRGAGVLPGAGSVLPGTAQEKG